MGHRIVFGKHGLTESPFAFMVGSGPYGQSASHLEFDSTFAYYERIGLRDVVSATPQGRCVATGYGRQTRFA